MSERYIEKDPNLASVVRKLLSHGKGIMLFGVVGAVLGFGIAKSIPKTYKVVSKVSPELSYRTGSLTSLAALAGVSTNMLNNTDALLPTVYPDVIKSQEFLAKLFDTEINSAKADTTLYGYITEYTRKSWMSSLMSLPSRIISSVMSLFHPDTAEADDTELDYFRLTKKQASVIKYLQKSIDVVVDKRTYLITISVTMQDPMAAAQLSQALLEHLKSFVSAYRTEKAKNDLAFFEEMHAEAEKDYYDAQKKLSWYADTHQGVVLQSSKVEQQRLQNDVNLKYQLFTSLSMQLQSAKAKVQQETPVFVEIVPPSVPVKKSGPSTMKYIMLFALLSLAAAMFHYYRN